jgi:hypothetical protein
MITYPLIFGLLLASGEKLGSSEPIPCRSITGFREYKVLEPVELTRDEKLNLYSEPSGFDVETDEATGEFHASLVIDARMRRKGSAKPIWEKKNLLEYEPRQKAPLGTVYLSTSFALKELRPGEYEVDLILRDGLNKAKEPHTRTVGFKVIESPE